MNGQDPSDLLQETVGDGLIHLDWEPCCNARLLEGLPARGGVVCDLIRSDAPDLVEPTLLRQEQVTTVIDLRNDDERPQARHTTLHLPLDGMEDREFWGPLERTWAYGCPIYYLPHVRRMPERSLRVLEAMATAPPGRVLFHCQVGRDRTGLIAILALLALGVSLETVAHDYLVGRQRLLRRPAHREEEMLAYLAARGLTLEGLLQDTLTQLVELNLVDTQLTQRLRARFVRAI